MAETLLKPNFLFEVSWEVCNQIGGMHTVLASKSVTLVNEFNNNYITIGPDLVQEAGENPEFIPDNLLYADWRQHAELSGLRIRIGRWKVPGEPITILVNFSDFLSSKDDIFSNLWKEYKLDSLSGQWDYIEPALFGYVAGKVIEDFTLYNLSDTDRIVAHFHEWMSSTGILYLKKALPQAGTIFTTHATVLGRSLSAENRLDYEDLSGYNADDIAKEFRIVSKQSLEKISAQTSDVFTTVSDITADECKHFLEKDVDLITPNGFEGSIVPDEPMFSDKKSIARSKMIKVASSLLSEELPENTFIVATSGRYRYKSKGIDIFIDTMAKLRDANLDRPVVAFLFSPSHHYGARKDLLEAMTNDSGINQGSREVTHYLHDAELDPILQRIHDHGFTNAKGDKVRIIYVPSFLNGSDGIFNLSYYDILIGCDQTVFATFYEPWGYTPLESLAFGVPTVTTSLAGIGKWIKEACKEPCKAITIIERHKTSDEKVIEKINDAIQAIIELSGKEKKEVAINAMKLASTTLWSSQIHKYSAAYNLALQKVEARSDSFVRIEEKPGEVVHEQILPLTNEPRWKRIIIRSKLPSGLERLNKLTENIWWAWDDEAQELFEVIDHKVWIESDYNPFVLFERVPYKRLVSLSKDEAYISKLNTVYDRFKKYIEGSKDLTAPKIAYFSMEFGFHDSLKLYSGGLGILAGDYLKEASDHKVNIVGIGILYRYGYFSQMLTVAGEQQANYDFQHFSKIPVSPIKTKDGDFLTIQIMLPGRIMYARIWELHVGRIVLYLLDTDFEQNSPQDRIVSHHLYGGDKENRLKQELLLGVGGIRALEALEISPDLYHSNEGHSAFNGLERIRILMRDKQVTFAEAKEIVRSTALFTTHTPVPAGHDHFDEDLLRKYLGHYPTRIRNSWEQFMALGRENPNNWDEKFNMSFLAANLAQEINGVSMLHGAVTREMFAKMWPGFLPEELHIGYVTNGVHWPTWTAKSWKAVYNRLFDGDFVGNQSNMDFWKRIYDVDDKEIWDLKQGLRTRLIDHVKERFKENWIKRHEDPKQIVAINNALSDKALTVVFARRFATYKRAHLLFNNLERLAKIVNDPERPVQFIFAGKAHPADKAGQALIKMIVDISKRPEFIGKILFLQNYSIGLAKLLVSGADIWLNTPTRPLEASGTSGEKAVMNGTLHFSVLDGWWVEGYQPDAGWALTNERTYENQEYQDNLDAEIIYSLFENEILPVFYDRNEQGVPNGWVKFIKNTIAEVSPKFTTRRMINDYVNQYYIKQFARSQKILENDFDLAKRISSWKKQILRDWDKIEVISVQLFDQKTDAMDTGTEYEGKVVLDLNGIDPKHVGVELIISENMVELVHIQQFKQVSVNGSEAVFMAKVLTDHPGIYSYGIRVYPISEFLPHRQDFRIIKWI